MKEIKDSKQSQIIIKAIGFGLATGVALVLLLTIIFSLIMLKQDIPLFAINPIITVILIFSTFAAAFITSKIIRNKGYLFGLIIAFALYLVVLLFSAVMFSEGITIASIFKLLTMLISGAIGGIFASNTKKR